MIKTNVGSQSPVVPQYKGSFATGAGIQSDSSLQQETPRSPAVLPGVSNPANAQAPLRSKGQTPVHYDEGSARPTIKMNPNPRNPSPRG